MFPTIYCEGFSVADHAKGSVVPQHVLVRRDNGLDLCSVLLSLPCIVQEMHVNMLLVLEKLTHFYLFPGG